MDLENIFEPYDEIKDDLKFITASDVKIRIIISLKNGQKKLSHLKKDVHINSSTILHNMRQLESRKLVIKEFQDYSLSQTGEIVALTIINMIKSIYVIKKNKDFWLNHKIEDIPDYLINEIECLSDITILDLESVTDVFKTSLLKSKNVKSILSNSIYKKPPFETILDKDFLNLILTENYLNEITQIKTEYNDKLLKSENTKLWRNNKDLKLNLIVLDDLMLLNLPPAKGKDEGKLYLISKDKKGVKWGTELFNHYFKLSEKFK